MFVVALAVSMFGLGWAVKYLPIGTAYAAWVGVGAALTVVYAMVTGAESVSAAKIVFIGGIIDAIVGASDITSMTDAVSPISNVPKPTPSSAPRSGAPMAITEPNAMSNTATATANPTSSAVRACSGSVRSTT